MTSVRTGFSLNAAARLGALAAVFALPAMLAGVTAGPALAADAQFTATRLTDQITVVSGPDGNVVVGAGDPGGLVVIDGGSAANAAALWDFIQSETGAHTIATLIDTDWHDDVTGLNAIAGAQGAQIVAHDNTQNYLQYGASNAIEGDHAPMDAAAVPNKVFYDDGGVLPFGEDEIRIGYLPQAHTDGDIYAYFPGADVLVTGGAVRTDGWNMIDWRSAGYIGGTLDSFDRMLKVADENTKVVPGSGPVIDKAGLQAQADMYGEIYDRLAKLLKASQSPEETVAAKPTEGFHPDWADTDRFVDQAYHSFYAHLRGDPRLGAIP